MAEAREGDGFWRGAQVMGDDVHGAVKPAIMLAEGAPGHWAAFLNQVKRETLQGYLASFFSNRGSRLLPHHEQEPHDANNHQQNAADSING